MSDWHPPSINAPAPFGGSVAGIGRYDDNSHDYSGHDHRGAAHRSERDAAAPDRGLAGPSVEFEPHRRDDVDAVFIAARPARGSGRNCSSITPATCRSMPRRTHGATAFSKPARGHAGIMLADIPWLLSNGTGT